MIEEKEQFEEEEGVIEESVSEEELKKEEAEFEAEADVPAEEFEALNASTEGLSGIRLYMRQIGQYDNLTADEEKELGAKAHAGDEAAREKLVNHNLRLVVSVAKKFIGRGVGIDDLISYGNLGLMEAVDRFDFSKDFKFSTYAFYWIRMEIVRGIQKAKNIVTKPDHVICAMNAVSKIQNELHAALTREPTCMEISMAMNGKFSEQQVEAIKSLMANNTPASLDKPLDAEDADSGTIGDLVADESDESPEEYTEKVERESVLAEAVAELTPQFRTVIRMRYGLGAEPGSESRTYTLDEIAERLLADGFANKQGGRYTKEYVRQIEANALAALKKNPKVQALGGIL